MSMSATHWRVLVRTSVNGQYIVFTEVAFLDAAGNDLSIGGSAIASSQYSGGFGPSMAFDKVLTSGSRWANAQGQFPAWIGYAHPAAVDVAFVRVWCDSLLGIGTAQCPPNNAAVSIERSADGVLWTSAGTTVWHGGAWGEGGVVLLSAAASIKATHPSRARVAASAPSASHASPPPSRIAFARDIEFGGAGRVWGTTKIKALPSNLPTKARVVLLHQRSKLPVRETWSDPVTGFFVFDGIDTRQEFITLAEHAAGLFLPVAANKLVPEALP